MTRILLLYYSQSGDVSRVAETFIEPLRHIPHAEVVVAPIEPLVPYPFPWGTFWRLLSVFPECHYGGGSGIRPLSIILEERFDLIVIAYQIWFLAPSIPIQDFLHSPYSRLLNGTKVITLCVSRNMWHSGSETMKRLLLEAGAIHMDNVVVTHQGSAFATLLTVPRLLITGRRDRYLGVFPPAEISQPDLDRVRKLGAVVAQKLGSSDALTTAPLLAGCGAVPVKRLLIVPELVGFYIYRSYARLAVAAGAYSKSLRQLVMSTIVLVVLLMVFIGLPVVILGTLVLYPFFAGAINRYAARLAEPSN